MAEVEIGIGRTARRAYRLDDVSIVPSRRTRDPEDVDVACEIDAYRFEMPILGAPTDSVVSPPAAAGRCASSRNKRDLDSGGEFTSKEGFSVVAPLSASTPSSTQGKRASG